MSPRLPAVDPGRLAQWCEERLGSRPVGEIFRSGFLSAVIGLRLADSRAVVVKVRPDSPRMAACVEVQRRLFESGYPCPEPLTGAAPFGDGVATAEAYVPGGTMLPGSGRSAWAFAGAFARLVTLAPRPAEVPAVDPPPSWADWNHAGAGLWPHPEDPDVNLNEVAGPAWIDDTGRRARDRLRAGASEAVIGHCDWLAANLRWNGDKLLVVHDWDSVTADSEAVLAGFAAALYSTVSVEQLATVELGSANGGAIGAKVAGCGISARPSRPAARPRAPAPALRRRGWARGSAARLRGSRRCSGAVAGGLARLPGQRRGWLR